MYVEAAKRAQQAGFDIIEVLCSDSNITMQFLERRYNRRADGYGGSLENRMRYPLEILNAVRERWQKPLSVRISATDWVKGGIEAADAVAIAKVLKEWRSSEHEEFAPRTAWSLHNAYTEIFKGSNPVDMTARSLRLHGLLDSVAVEVGGHDPRQTDLLVEDSGFERVN